MDTLCLFTDGSVDSKSKIGYGAYLIVTESEISSEFIKSKIKLKRFENTSSSKLELQTLIWAMDEIANLDHSVISYTDSQNIVSLPDRRGRIEKNNYRSKNNKLLTNLELYREFFRMIDKVDCRFVKVIGHQKSNQKHDIERLFTLVDRASRKALRNDQSGIYY